jgi:hypothetical protein
MLTRLGLGKTDKKAESRGWTLPDREQVKQRLETLRRYRWSSYPSYAGYCKTPEWLAADDILERAGKVASKRRQVYRADAKRRITKGLPEDFQEKKLEGFVLGAETFRKKIKDLANPGREISGKQYHRTRVPFQEMGRIVEIIRGS